MTPSDKPMHLGEGDFPPLTSQIWRSASGSEEWLVAMRWQVLNGRAECVGLEIVSAAPADEWQGKLLGKRKRRRGRPVTATLLRQLPIGRIIASERAGLAWLDDSFQEAGTRRPKATPAHLQEAADVYREAWAKGHPTGRALQEHFQVSASAARKLAFQARQAGLLPKTDPGVATAIRRRRIMNRTKP